MDRRQALKKLGVGSAVAVSAPVLLDTFNVAHASSLPFPPGVDLIATATVNQNSGAVTIDFVNPGEFPAGTTFTWAFPSLPNNTTFSTPLGNGTTTSTRAVVDKTSGNSPTPAFTLTMTARLVGNTPETQVYFLDYTPPTTAIFS